MNFEHKELAWGRWDQMPFAEQMANVGSEISRALNWQKKGNVEYCRRAVNRTLELLFLTIDSVRVRSHYKELTRLHEAIVDYFYGENIFSSTEKQWRTYFDAFVYAARKNITTEHTDV